MPNLSRNRHRPMAEINVVPYIDVMLVLLVIFMITAPLLREGVKVTLPQTMAEKLASEQSPIIVSIDATGKYFLNTSKMPDVPLNATDLINAVNAERQAKRAILIKGDKAVDYGKVVQVFALLQQAGIDNVGLVTEPNPTPIGG